ncbi:MAG: radical SAM protein [Cyanomargarita calcarea GSE-NOS-MK-12-04C]|jgi:MoaA/NifB/PqqE/SkfB family radical SAM enzyme|uniref:Radical SAM protein n=1 Tax=Cyanomargarita calcarea GSE-NOS-MK-12-04C TaxID=2839659 RepID=A0A951QHL7_9CYAN|nr:radical SAM protein [Cyanomargarita calcarea GSE-NOS-MK-12-04C]
MSQKNLASQTKRRSLWQMALEGLQNGGPSTCQFAITSSCNARCGFCSFAVDSMPIELRHSVTLEDAKQAAEILYQNGVYFLIYVGGEPMMHPHLNEMIAHASSIGMAAMLVTNGSLLTPQKIHQMADAGLTSVIISIDAADAEKHEQNRGLKEVCERIREANTHFQNRKIGTTASVTMSRLVDYQKLPDFLKSLGFDSVTFSYPLTTLASSYLGYAQSNLVDYTVEELNERFETIKALKKDFQVVNPTASIEDMQRHLQGEAEEFGCLGGWKQFYLDWHLNLYRCHNWDKPMCHITEFDGSQRVRDGCTACMIDCYRDSSVMQHVGVAVSDGVKAAAKGNFPQAWKHWFNRKNLLSLQAVWEQAQWLRRL